MNVSFEENYLYCFFLQATTDTDNSCTLRHTGTSAAAPLAAGIIALALQAKLVIISYQASSSVYRYNSGTMTLHRGVYANVTRIQHPMPL